MELENSFVVDLPPDETYDLLLDVPRIAKCMPGATLESFEGDEITGRVRVKLGPVAMTYSGQARIVEADRDNLRTVIEARGLERRGASEARAKVTATLRAIESGTQVAVVTDLNITGKPAQLGRGLMADVGRMLIGQFATALAQDIESGGADHTAPLAAPGATSIASAEGSVVDAADRSTVMVQSPPVASGAHAKASEDTEINALALIRAAVPKRVIRGAAGGVAALLLFFGGRRSGRRGNR